ncbi:MAG: winged helix-turn-helix domain-containing protein [Saprospiraceae bacterium]|nr:winged helix-turn-helix domain-containing protein [Saprospiraceae bacterium]
MGYSGKPKEVCNKIASNLNLKEEFLDENLKSGTNRFQNQVAWASISGKDLDSSTRGLEATELGQNTTLDYESSQKFS